MNSDGKVFDGATCEIPDYKALMEGVVKGDVKDTPWIDEKAWDNGRVLETFISSDAVDVQGDSILQRGLVKVMPWLNKYGYYEWHHTGFPVGHYLGWRMKDGKVQVRVGFHDTAHSNMPAHDKAWQIVREFGAKGRSSIKGAPNAIKKLMSGVRVIDDLGCFAVGWVGDNAANPFAEVTSVSFAKGAFVTKKVEMQGDRWAVVSEGAADPIATFATKEEADATLQAIEGNKNEDAKSTDAFSVPNEKSSRAPDSLHDKIAKELFGKALQDLDDIQKAQVTRRAEELLQLQAEELFKERAAGHISLAVYGELLMFKEQAAITTLQKDEAGTLGAVLTGHIHRAYTVYCDELVMKGILSTEQRIKIGNAIGDMLRTLSESLPLDLAAIQVMGGDEKSEGDKTMDDDKKVKVEEKKPDAEKPVEKEDSLGLITPVSDSYAVVYHDHLVGQYDTHDEAVQALATRKSSIAKGGLEDRAARALDLTHGVGERGPKTMQARDRIATALDTGKQPSIRDIEWLESLANTPEQKSARLRIKAWLVKAGVIKPSAKELIKEWVIKAHSPAPPQEREKDKEAKQ